MPDDGAGGFVLRDGQSHGITIPADGAGGPPVFAFVRKGFLDAAWCPPLSAETSTLSRPVPSPLPHAFITAFFLTHMR